MNKYVVAFSFVCIAIISLAFFSCGGGKPSGPSPTVSIPPAATPTLVPPTTVLGQPVAQFYKERCAQCHGEKREGLIGPALTPARLSAPDAFYADTVKNGRPGTTMVGFPTLGDNDIAALVHYIKYTKP